MLQNKLHPSPILNCLLSYRYYTDLHGTSTYRRYVYGVQVVFGLFRLMILAGKEAILCTGFLAEFNSIFQVFPFITLYVL